MKKKLILWQRPMQNMLYALLPLAAASVWFYGWRSLLLLSVVSVTAFLVEYLALRPYGEPVSSAVFVTAFLFTLSLPPTIPLWMAVLGIVVAVLFGKMVFGGFGRNVFNPAMVGRAFLYVSFGSAMTGSWAAPFTVWPGGLARFAPDALSGATPLASGNAPLLDLLIGRVSGSLGEASALLILLGGIYILWKKNANYRIVVSGLVGFLLLQTIFWLAKVPANNGLPSLNPLYSLLGGGALFGIFFIMTDPISAASTNGGRWLFGFFVGSLTVLIRTFSAWPEGLMFAVLLGNMFAPITDYAIQQHKKARKERAAAKGAAS